jgi:hypothetical protein
MIQSELAPTDSQNSFFIRKPESLSLKKNFKKRSKKPTNEFTNASTDTDFNSIRDSISQQNNQKLIKFLNKQNTFINKKNSFQKFEKISSKTNINVKSLKESKNKLTEEIIYKLAKDIAGMIETTANELKTSASITENTKETNFVDTRNILNETDLNIEDNNFDILIKNLKQNLSVAKTLNETNFDKKDEKVIYKKCIVPKRRIFKILESPLNHNVKTYKENIKNEKVNYNLSSNFAYKNNFICYKPPAVINKEEIYHPYDNFLLPACIII